MKLSELFWALEIQLSWDNNPPTCWSNLLKGYSVWRMSVHTKGDRKAAMKIFTSASPKVCRFCLMFLYTQGQYMRRHNGDMIGRASHS